MSPGIEPDLTREGGSIPVTLTLQEATEKDVLLLPMGACDDGAHSQVNTAFSYLLLVRLIMSNFGCTKSYQRNCKQGAYVLLLHTDAMHANVFNATIEIERSLCHGCHDTKAGFTFSSEILHELVRLLKLEFRDRVHSTYALFWPFLTHPSPLYAL